ncbi:MAG: hypothetical protein L3J12_10365 [Spirochaetales bacterium]|nr:hypothetical protein [Spirochaetales bacterium]
MNTVQWNYESEENWYQVVEGQASCGFCGKESKGIFFISEEESVCLPCILDFFREISIDKILNTMTDGVEILKAFEPESSPLLKIGMLLNMDELSDVLKRIPEKTRFQILYFISLSLGYNSSHPLSSLLREIAVNKIILEDETFLKVLLNDIEVDLTKIYPIDSQVFLYNLSLTLSFLAPYNKLTRALIIKVLEIAKRKKDTFILNWFVLKNGYYLPEGQFFSGKHDTAKLINSYKIATEVSVSRSASSDYRVKQSLDSLYTLKYLKNIYNFYLHNIHERAEISPQFVWPGKKAKKGDYIRIFAEILMNKRLVETFIREMPDWVRISFEEMLWEDRSLSLNEFRRRGNLKNPKTDRYDYYYEPVLPPESQFFQVWVREIGYSSKGEVFLYLDKDQKDLFRLYLPVPDNCQLQMKDSNNPEFFVSSNTEVLTDIQLLTAYLQQVGVKRTKNGIKILKASIKDIRKVCNIREPYPEVKELENLRLTMLIELVEKFLKKNKGALNFSKKIFIKNIFSFYFNPKKKLLYNYIRFLDYLKFRYISNSKSDLDRYYLERIAVQKLLNQLVVGKWVGIGNIHRYFNIQGIIPEPVNLTGYVGDIYFSSKRKDSYGNYQENIDVRDSNRGEVIYRPYLKVLMFVLNLILS